MKTRLFLLSISILLNSFAFSQETQMRDDTNFLQFELLDSGDYEIKKCSFSKKLKTIPSAGLNRLGKTHKRKVRKLLKNELSKSSFKKCWKAYKSAKKLTLHMSNDVKVNNAIKARDCSLEEYKLLKTSISCTGLLSERRICLNLSKADNTKNKMKNTGTSLKIIAGVLFFPAFFFPNGFDNTRYLLQDTLSQIYRYSSPEIVRVGIDKLNSYNLVVETTDSNILINSQSKRYYLAPTNSRWGEYKFIRKFKQVFTHNYSTENGKTQYINSNCE